MKAGDIIERKDGTRRGGRVKRVGPRPGRVLVKWSGGNAVDELWSGEWIEDLTVENSGRALLREVA